jgi:hypothetical protein
MLSLKGLDPRNCGATYLDACFDVNDRYGTIMVNRPEAGNRQTGAGSRPEPRHKLPGLDGIKVSITRADRIVGPDFWIGLLGFVSLQIAIAVGWIAATGGRLNDSWKTVLIALAAAALGFGVAQLLARHSADSQGRELERDYEELRDRSKRLLRAVDKIERPSRSSESSASSDTAT